jgi:hypothetical protein
MDIGEIMRELEDKRAADQRDYELRRAALDLDTCERQAHGLSRVAVTVSVVQLDSVAVNLLTLTQVVRELRQLLTEIVDGLDNKMNPWFDGPWVMMPCETDWLMAARLALGRDAIDVDDESGPATTALIEKLARAEVEPGQQLEQGRKR